MTFTPKLINAHERNPKYVEGLMLEHVSIVEIGSYLTGPYAASMLGDLGADVVKIEPPEGGTMRHIGPRVNDDSSYFASVNRNKQYITLNLTADEGQKILRDLLQKSDVLIENLKTGSMDKYGFGYDDISELNEDLIYCSVHGFHRESSYAEMPAMDPMMQGMSGMMSVTGERDRAPGISWMPVADYCASMYASQAVLAALYNRDMNDADGTFIEVPMLDSIATWAAGRLAYSMATREPHPRGRFHPNLVPYGPIETKDSYLVVAISTDDKWPRLCRALGMENLAEDERFQTNADRYERAEKVYDLLGERLREKTTAEWFDLMREHSVPAAPVYNTLEMWEDQYIRERQLRERIQEESPNKAMDIVRPPMEFDGERPPIRIPPKPIGSDTDRLLLELGYSEETISRWRDAGVI